MLSGFIRAWAKGTRWVYDAKNRDEAVALLKKYAKLEDNYARHGYESSFNAAAWDKDGAVNVPAIQAVIDSMGEAGDFQPPLPKVEKFIDTSYWERSVKTLP